MKISVLAENVAGSFTGAEHGLSYLIEADGRKILFDTGQSNLFMKNAAVMGVSLDQTDMIVLSHGHFDHGDGLEYLSGGHLVCHPECFIKRYRKADHSYIGLKKSRAELEERFNLITSAEPLKISDSVIFAGGIPRITTFESQETPFVLKDGSPDFVYDDSALIVITSAGLFIISGCGHSGIVNIIEDAAAVTGIDMIYGIIGGFHLKETNRQTTETIDYLKKRKVTIVLPSHCTTGSALDLFHATFGSRTVKTGDILSF